MPRLVATFDLKPWERAMKGAPRLIRAHTRRRLSYWGQRHKSDIKRHSNVFRYREGGATGKLLASIWTERAKGGHRHHIAQHLGWGVPYGEVMEFGPSRSFTWEIVPTGFSSAGRSGGATGLRFLRFQSKGKIHFAKKVIHRWTPRELRLHVLPSMKRLSREYYKDMSTISQRVIEGELR
jgi:hypothetical protein